MTSLGTTTEVTVRAQSSNDNLRSLRNAFPAALATPVLPGTGIGTSLPGGGVFAAVVDFLNPLEDIQDVLGLYDEATEG